MKNKEQAARLFDETIMNSLYEDFQFENSEQVREVIDYLISNLQRFNVEDKLILQQSK